MALTLTQLLDGVARDLQDPEHIRWTRSELLDYFNAAQRAFSEQRPDQLTQERDLVLSAGWRHMLPDDVLTLMDITNNVGGTYKRITKTTLWQVDAVLPNWRSASAGREVLHFMHDMRNPKEFLVYPPALQGLTVRAVVTPAVTDLTDETQAPAVPERWMDALHHFVLYRAWSKDAEYGGNQSIAAAHLQLFNNALGVQSKAANEMAPTV